MNGITRAAIADTLKSLLREKPLSRITVTDISTRCGISRMTFYYHFRDIYDLVGWIISSDIASILSGRKTHDTWEEGFLALFRAVEENQAFVLNAYSSLSREQLERSLRHLVDELILSVLRESERAASVSADDEAFISSFFSYAFIGIMLDWIGGGMRERPEDIMRSLSCIMDGALEHAINGFCTLHR